MHNQKVLQAVKEELRSDPAALRWLANLEENFPATLEKFLQGETPKERLVQMARQAEQAYEEMSEALAPEIGMPAAMSEAAKECLLVNWEAQ